ncbi:deaminase [Streptomyces winkii]|uniref:nucleoside deaminase n=1 Tax=Streptomyces winkii TaxID=3051178 RepID=UPI0037DA61D4
MNKDNIQEYMSVCIGLARAAVQSGNYGLGAIVLKDGEIIGESGSGLVNGCDPTGHPEIVAIRMAAERLKSRYLTGAFLVTTLEPCPMCTSAAIWAKMKGIAYGATQLDAIEWSRNHPHETYTWRQIHIRSRDVVRAGEPRLELHEEVLRKECIELFSLTGRSSLVKSGLPGAVQEA